ncbi:hypothetical protein D0T84_01195 [Dysgonomonas sp. 521]|uniref:hypothetical protein n=1 Tax=Dysgonomonas sp. 521 TaxID=2302932 RepID=UPI0013D4AF4B|nr:hypothetical protein [Dysgonomonas sp. 521]NDV93532.1 hypothetical protein [Dysgonomonas sp. 521]
METIVLDGQSLFDIAIQQSGSAEAAFALSVANDISISGEVSANTSLENTSILNRRFTEYYKLKNLKPTTYSSNPGEIRLRGIGNMAIEKDFIVSDDSK